MKEEEKQTPGATKQSKASNQANRQTGTTAYAFAFAFPLYTGPMMPDAPDYSDTVIYSGRLSALGAQRLQGMPIRAGS